MAQKPVLRVKVGCACVAREVLGFCCYEHQELMPCSNPPKPSELPPHVSPASLYCPLLAPPPSPRAAALAPAAEYHVAHHFASAVPNQAANPASFMQGYSPGGDGQHSLHAGRMGDGRGDRRRLGARSIVSRHCRLLRHLMHALDFKVTTSDPCSVPAFCCSCTLRVGSFV